MVAFFSFTLATIHLIFGMGKNENVDGWSGFSFQHMVRTKSMALSRCLGFY